MSGFARRTALSVACTFLITAAPAEEYPSRRIMAVVPFPAGSGTDPVARFIGERVSRAFKQPFVVENKPGANGAIGATDVARARPDGYTILFGTNSTNASYPHLVKTMAYDPVTSFEPVTRITLNPQMLVIRPEIPATNLAEFIAYAKANPGKLNYGVGNTGGIVANQQFKAMTGIDAVQVPYRGANQAVMDMLGGRLNYMFTDPSLAQAYVANGTMRALAVTSAARMSAFPNLPTMAEAGLPGYEIVSWIAVFVPAKTPPAIIETLGTALRNAVNSPEAKPFFESLQMEPSPTSSDELRTFVSNEISKWGELIKAAGIEKQ